MDPAAQGGVNLDQVRLLPAVEDAGEHQAAAGCGEPGQVRGQVDEPVVDTVREALSAMAAAGWLDRIENEAVRVHPIAEHLDSGVLVTRDGDGHTGYNSGNECVDTAIEDYLVDGVVPDDGLTC